MALKDTIKHLKDLLSNITSDLDKSDNGNKAASQRVRTGTVKLEKIAKLYRKESIKHERATKGTKKSSSSKKSTAKKATHKKAAHKPVAKAKTKVTKSKPKAKAHKAKARALSFKKPTAKILTRKFSFR
ncbi:MAG: histone [Parachlamydiaceae bacterium]